MGLLFGWGLMLSGMTDPGKVQGFLELFGAWDPSLAFLLGGAIGVGWGLAGFCPGPGIVAMAAGQAKAAVFVLAMLAGMLIYKLMERSGAVTATANPGR